MKNRLISIILVFFLIITLPAALSEASQTLCFTAVNDTLLPLRDSTMPAYIGTYLYVPSSVFTEFGISSGTSSSRDNLYVYKSSDNKRLTFYISLGLVMDQDGTIYEDAGLKIISGLYFLPLDFICGFFNLSYTLISNDPVSVLRIKNSDAVLNEKTFIGTYKTQMDQAYKAYSTPTATTPPPTATPTNAMPTETPVILDYSDTTVYLSFYNVTEPYATTILNTLASYSVTACFFLSASDIADNPELVRRISGEKHMVGIWLDNSSYDKYVDTQSLLFEASKHVTPLVASNEEIAGDVAAMCDEYGLIYRTATIMPTSDENATAAAAHLSKEPYTSDDMRFDCSQNTTRILSAIIRHLNNLNYNVSIICETSPHT